jgi:hypothetical protein
MKVTGTGNPASLTLRLREREVAGLKEELGHRARSPTMRRGVRRGRSREATAALVSMTSWPR